VIKIKNQNRAFSGMPFKRMGSAFARFREHKFGYNYVVGAQ